ncbi:unnamed protein product, partial [Iphiclides podalirius]
MTSVGEQCKRHHSSAAHAADNNPYQKAHFNYKNCPRLDNIRFSSFVRRPYLFPLVSGVLQARHGRQECSAFGEFSLLKRTPTKATFFGSACRDHASERLLAVVKPPLPVPEVCSRNCFLAASRGSRYG